MTAIDHAARTAELEAEEARLGFDRFDFAEAWAIGRALVETAPAPQAIRIHVADRGVLAAARDGTTGGNQVWLDLKSAVVRQFGQQLAVAASPAEGARPHRGRKPVDPHPDDRPWRRLPDPHRRPGGRHHRRLRPGA